MIQISLGPSDTLHLDFGDHFVDLPFDLRGLFQLHNILVANAKGQSKIATPGAPTQWNIEQWLRNHSPRRAEVDGLEIDLEGIVI